MKSLLIFSKAIKKNVLYLLLGLILLYGFLIRFNYLGNTFRFADSYRDYLVGRNIVRENSLIMIGPHNGAFGTFSSPIYFYLIAGILSLNQNIIFLEFVLVTLQLVSIYAIFLIGKNLFSMEAGLIAAGLYSFSRIILQQSNFIWQPNLMQPIFILSLYFLVRSYKSRDFKYFLLSAILAILAITLYNSALGMLIPLVIIFFFVFKKNSWDRLKAIVTFLVVGFTLFLLYLPPAIYHLTNQKSIISETTQSLAPATFLERFPQNLKYLIHLNGYHISGISRTDLIYKDLLSNILMLIIILLTIYYLITKKVELNKKLTVLLLILFITSPVLISSFSKSFIQARHFFLILIPLSLLIGEVISKRFNNSTPQLPLKILLVVLLIKGFMLNPSDFSLVSRTQPNGQLSEQTFQSIREDIIRTRSEYNLDTYNFFQFNIYPNTPEINGWSDAEFWVKLENFFKNQFTKNDDSSLYLAYKPLNDDQFVYLVCDSRIMGTNSMNKCIADYSKSSNYQIVRKVTEDSFMSVFLTTKLN